MTTEQSVSKGFESFKFKDVITKFQNGYAFGAQEYSAEGIPIISMGNIGLDGQFKISRKTNFWPESEKPLLTQYIVKHQSLIMAMTDVTPTMELIGRGCIVTVNQEYFLNQRVGLITVDETKVNKKYLSFYTNFEIWRSYCISMCGLGAQANLGTAQILNGQLYLPPLSQQKKIAKILTTVDNLIEQTQALIDKYTAIKQGMMADLFTRGIDLSGTPETNPNHGQLRPSFEEAPELYKETELGWVPREWDVKPLNRVVNFLDGQRIPLKKEDRFEMSGEYRYYGASGIIDYINQYIFDGVYILLGEDGENVISRNSPLAFKVFGKFWVSNHAHILSLQDNQDVDFYTEYLESLDYKNIVSGSAQPKLTQSQLSRLTVVNPPYVEQIRIAHILSSINQRLCSETLNMGKIAEVKKGLMQDLLTGKVQVTA